MVSALVGTVALAAGAISARAAPLPRYGVFVFGSMCTAPYSGDAAGYRLTLMRYGDGDHVLFQWSEGPAVEAAGYKVRIDNAGSHISFSVDIPGTPAGPQNTQDFSGDISEEAVTLSGGYVSPGRLPRVRNLAVRKTICQPVSEDQK